MRPFTIVHVDTHNESLAHFTKIAAEINAIELAGSFTTTHDALAFLRRQPVDLVFIDLMMPSAHDGLWLANQLQDNNTGIVFLSTCTEHAATAFEKGALDFISKPVTRELLENCLNRIKQRLQTLKRLHTELSGELNIDEPSVTRRLFINTHAQIIVINLKDVTYLKSVSNYTAIQMRDGRKYVATKHLKVYDNAVQTNPDFLRVHRSTIINKNFVKAIIRKGHKASVLMEDNEMLEISVLKKNLILEELCR